MNNINKYEEKVFSQNGEDGVVLYLIEIIAKKYDLDKSYFEFGVEDGSECITRIIREKLDWKGTILDGGNENKKIKLCGKKSKFNEKLYEKYDIPARQKIKEVLGDNICDNPDKYGEDMILLIDGCKYKYLEFCKIS